MKLTTYNVNGIRARLPRLLEWLEREKPDVVCLQELKCADESLPIADIEAAGYGAVWHGQKGFNGVAILARGERAAAAPDRPSRRSRRQPQPLYRGRSRRASSSPRIYLPNGNPVGTEKFDYKLRWMERLRAHARASCLREERPVVLAGDWNVVPEDRDVFSARATAHDALLQPETRAACRRILNQGWTDALRALHPDDRSSTPSGTIPPAAGSATRASASIICCARPKPPTGCAAPASTNGRAARRRLATTRRPGSSWPDACRASDANPAPFVAR